MSTDSIADVLGGQKPSGVTVPVKENPNPDKPELTSGEFVQHVGVMESVSRRASEPVHRLWDKSWGLYNNAYDFSQKATWQSKNFIPRLNMTIRAATFMVKRALLGPAKPFTVEGIGDFGKLVAYYMDRLAMHHLEEAKYTISITDSLHAGLITSLMVLKVYPVYVTEDSVYWTDNTPKPALSVAAPVKTVQYKRLKIRVDAVDPYKVHLDPTGQNKFIIHDIDMDLYDLMEIAADKTSGYDLEEVKKIDADYNSIPTEGTVGSAEVRAGQVEDATKSRRKRNVFIQEYWGDVWSSDGKLVARNCVYAIANKKYLVRKPVINTFPDKKNPPPFIVSPVVRKPFSVWHQGFAEVVSGLNVMMTELMNLMLDANLFSSAKAFEIDIDQVYDPLEFLQGIAPGKSYKKRGGGFNTAPMIKEVQIGQVAQQSLAIYQSLDREFQNGIGLNEFAMPTSPTRSRTTATEVMEKSQSATTFMEEIARTVEETCLEPLVEKVFHYIVEYQLSFDDPFMVELFGADEASKLSLFMRNPAFRRAMHSAPLKFKARGLSASIGKMRDLDKIMTLSKALQPYPQLQAQVDPQKIMNKTLEAMGWYPQEILVEMQKPPAAPPPMVSAPMPQMPLGNVGDLAALLGNAGGQQAPPMS